MKTNNPMTPPQPIPLEELKELLPCPFCAAIPKLHDSEYLVIHNPLCAMVRAGCFTDHWIVGRNVEFWNTRASSSLAEAMRLLAKMGDIIERVVRHGMKSCSEAIYNSNLSKEQHSSVCELEKILAQHQNLINKVNGSLPQQPDAKADEKKS